MSRHTPEHESAIAVGSTSKSRDQYLGIFTARASRMATVDGNFRFRILQSAFEKAAGFHLRVGRVYSIKGRIEGVGSFDAMHIGAKRKCIFLYAPFEYRQNLKARESYKIVLISIEQRKSFRVETIRGWPQLTFRQAALESAGLPHERFSKDRRGILELGIRSLSASENLTRKVFGEMQLNRESKIVHLRVGKLGGKQGDLFELLTVRAYSQEQFIKDFNSHRQEDMKNARLSFRENTLGLKVDGHFFPFKDSHLDSYSLEVLLVARFQEGKRQFRFWFDGEHSRAAYDGTGKISRFIATRDRLKFVFVPKEREVTAARASLRQEIEQFKTGLIIDKVRLLSKEEGTENRFSFEVDSSVQNHVNSRLSHAESKYEIIAEKGKVAEEINPAILSHAGWIEVRRHPSSEGQWQMGSTYPGPDSLMRRESSSDLYFFEHKWWTYLEPAFKQASIQLGQYKNYDIGPETRKVKGAYAALLDWDCANSTGELHLRKVWPKE